MTHQDVLTHAPGRATLPDVRTITLADLKEALRRGFDDFTAMPSHAVFISIIYPMIGLFIGRLAFGYDVLPLLFPLAAGFALLGPFAALGLYELSRQREQGRPVSWREALDVFHSPSFGSILVLGLSLTALFLVWVAIAHAVYIAHFGYRSPESILGFLNDVLTTRTGWSMMLIGNGIGFLFALVALVVTAISFPLLLDREVGAATAVATSVRVFLRNPVTMSLWGLIVAALLALGSLPALIGLAVVMPLLGHATWHLYRRAVEPGDIPRREPPPETTRHRPVADFPVSLFKKVDDEAPGSGR